MTDYVRHSFYLWHFSGYNHSYILRQEAGNENNSIDSRSSWNKRENKPDSPWNSTNATLWKCYPHPPIYEACISDNVSTVEDWLQLMILWNKFYFLIIFHQTSHIYERDCFLINYLISNYFCFSPNHRLLIKGQDICINNHEET